MYKTSYLKPEYSYVAKSGDPELFFESEFGTTTNFSAKINAVGDGARCSAGLKRVAYKQAMDSYYRDPEAPGPWKIAAPADTPILVTGHWFVYGLTSSSTVNGLTSTTSYPNTSCRVVEQIFTPKANEKYLVRLTKGPFGACAMAVTKMDGSAVEITQARQCSNK